MLWQPKLMFSVSSDMLWQPKLILSVSSDIKAEIFVDYLQKLIILLPFSAEKSLPE